MQKILLSICIVTLSLNCNLFANTFQGQAWVIDGDSLRVSLKDHTKVEVRLYGINAPEMPTRAGIKAKWAMIDLIKTGGRFVTCLKITTDKYKRTVAICNNSHGDLAKKMLEIGHARPYYRFLKNPLPSVPKDITNIYLNAYKNKKSN